MADFPGHSINTLLGEVMRDTTDLARKELSLFKTELSENVRTLLIGIGMIAGAAIFAVAAIILFTEALVKWLATVVGSEALSALIVGGVMTLIAIGLVMYGRSTMSAASLAPMRSVRSIQRDTQVLSEKVAG
jgi:putative superfamily III holin-X